MIPPPVYNCCVHCCKSKEQVHKEWKDSTPFDYYVDKKALDEMANKLKVELRAVWPGGFEVNTNWMMRGNWSLIRPWKIWHRCKYRTKHQHHY